MSKIDWWRVFNPKVWYVAFAGDMYRVKTRVHYATGASFPHQMYVRARSSKEAMVKAAKKYSPGLFIEVTGCDCMGEMI